MNAKFESFLKSIKGKTVGVVGIGVSNTPVITMFAKAGAKVIAYDKNEQQNLGDIASELINLGVTLVCGKDYLDSLSGDIIIKTPGLRFDHPALLNAAKNGATITSEMELFFEYCPCKIVAVTGSDGKTTTTSIIYQMLKASGKKVHLGGNIGRPLLPQIEQIKPDDVVVAELSSFQLHTMKKSADIAVVTNLSPNHLDMHKDMDEYVFAKTNIFAHQSGDGVVVLNYDNDITNGFEPMAKGSVKKFSFNSVPDCDGAFYKDQTIFYKQGDDIVPVVKKSDVLIRGDHNIENYMAAITALWGIVTTDVMLNTARTFSGVRHRIEFVATKNGVSYYNDSIGSSPTRTIATLKSFDQKVILIAGGYDKKLSYDPLAPEILQHAKALFLTGATANKIKLAVESAKEFETAKIDIFVIDEFDDAVNCAAAYAKTGDIVLLSPASASFDKFKNFEVRGDRFVSLVNQLN